MVHSFNGGCFTGAFVSCTRLPYVACHLPVAPPTLHWFVQTELNKLDVVVSLKLNQLYCMDNAVEGHTGEGGEDEEKPRFAAFYVVSRQVVVLGWRRLCLSCEMTRLRELPHCFRVLSGSRDKGGLTAKCSHLKFFFVTFFRTARDAAEHKITVSNQPGD